MIKATVLHLDMVAHDVLETVVAAVPHVNEYLEITDHKYDTKMQGHVVYVKHVIANNVHEIHIHLSDNPKGENT
jgi:hypothetical protein